MIKILCRKLVLVHITGCGVTSFWILPVLWRSRWAWHKCLVLAALLEQETRVLSGELISSVQQLCTMTRICVLQYRLGNRNHLCLIFLNQSYLNESFINFSPLFMGILCVRAYFDFIYSRHISNTNSFIPVKTTETRLLIFRPLYKNLVFHFLVGGL